MITEDYANEIWEIINKKQKELQEKIMKEIDKLYFVTGCKYSDNKNIHMIQREELKQNLNKLFEDGK